MKKLKQILAILVIGTLLFTACDNRDEVEEVEEQVQLSPCNYTFTATAVATDIIFESATATTEVTLNIAKQNSNVSCGEEYTMDWVVKKDGISQNTDGFAYSTQNDMPIGNSTGTFTAIGIGTYTIEITVTNDGADTNKVQTETVTINVTYPPIEIVLTEPTDDIYVNQNAAYSVGLSGANPDTAALYNVTLTAAGDDLMPDISGDIALGSNSDTQDNFNTFTIKPTAVGIATYTLTVEQDGVTATQDFTLISKAPEFDVVLRLGGDLSAGNGIATKTIDVTNDPDDDVALRVRVNSIIPSGIDYPITYTYLVEDADTSASPVDLSINPDSGENPHDVEALNGNVPNPGLGEKYTIGGVSTSLGVEEIRVTVTNNYGSSITKSIWIEIE